MNAYACGIIYKRSFIVVSKGLLKFLTRDELQCVIAHELSHIINRDTLFVSCSDILYKISDFYNNLIGITRLHKIVIDDNDKGAEAVFLFFIYFLSFPIIIIGLIGQGICYMLRKLISKEREYLADALLKIEKASKKGRYNIYDDLDETTANHLVKASFFIPVKDKRDNWKSTHPSTENRIKILLNMTSADFREYEKVFEKINNKKLLPKSALESSETAELKQFPSYGGVPQAGWSKASACSSFAVLKFFLGLAFNIIAFFIASPFFYFSVSFKLGIYIHVYTKNI